MEYDVHKFHLTIDKIIFIIFQIIAFLSIILLMAFSLVETKESLVLLPLGYLFINSLFFVNFMDVHKNMAKLLILTISFVRLAILPGMYAFCVDSQLFLGHVSILLHFTDAVYLMLYEYVAIQVVIFLYENTSFHIPFKIRLPSFPKKDYSGVILMVLTVYVILVAILFPQILDRFKTIFSLTDPDFNSGVRLLVEEGLQKSLFTFFSFCFNILRVMIPVYILYRIYSKNPRSSLSTWVLVIGCGVQFFMLSSTFAEALVVCLTLSMAYLYLYPKRIKRVYVTFGFFSVIMAIVYFVVRFIFLEDIGMYNVGFNNIEHFAQVVNAYFTGIENVSAALNIPSGFEWDTIKATLIGCIPFNTTLISILPISRAESLAYYFNLYNIAQGQIPPTLGSGYYYFGFLFAPIITSIFVYCGLKCNEWAKQAINVMQQSSLQFCAIVFALGTGMYSDSITLAWIGIWGIPMLLISGFTIKK